MITNEDVLGALRTVQDPEFGQDLVSLNMIRDIRIEGERVSFTVVLTTPACPLGDGIPGSQGTRADAISRAVARDRATMYLRGELVGQHNESRGHLDCRGMLLSEHAKMHAIPELLADSAPRSQLSHEAAVGPIAEEAVEYLMTRGLSRDIAISTLVRGFMQIDLPGLPEILTKHIQRVLASTAEHSL